MTADTETIVKGLEAFTTCDVADALLKLQVPHGGFLEGLTMWSPRRQEGASKIIGPAYTVKYVQHAEAAPQKPPGHYIDTVPRGAVIFISAPSGMVNTCYGGLMSTRARYLGAVGTVIDGRLRDLQEHRDLGFPVFARDVGTTAPQEVARVSEIGSAVHLSGASQEVVIHAGDIVVGDLNGVVCIPRALADRTLDLIQSQVDADEKVARDIKMGRTVHEAMSEHRAHVKRP